MTHYTMVGHCSGSGKATSLSAGSLLDDNTWHDALVSRARRDLVFSVDRVVMRARIKGEFSRLNLNRAVCTTHSHKLHSKCIKLFSTG